MKFLAALTRKRWFWLVAIPVVLLYVGFWIGFFVGPKVWWGPPTMIACYIGGACSLFRGLN